MSFSKRAESFEKRWQRTYTFNWFVIVICSFLLLAFIIAFGFFTVKSYKAVEEQGLKNVIERVWEGRK